tara:strand:- start:47 stop:1849 length:1803 start_codon:yes stop_codon:yes gene_type:complete
MIIHIFSSILFFFITLFTSIGYGLIFKKIILKNNSFYSYGELGIYGLFFLSLISIIMHFFVSLNAYLNLLIVIFGISVIFFKVDLIKKFKKRYIVIFLLLFPSLIFFEYHADYFWYHLPYINVAHDYKIIFGLANLNDNLGYSHIWYDILAILNLPYFETYYLSVVAIVFLFFFLIFLSEYYSIFSNKFTRTFIIFCISFIAMIYSNSKDYGSEIQVNLIYLMISIYIFQYFNENKITEKYYIIQKIFLIFLFSILIRTNSIIFFPLILFFLLFNFKILYNFILNFKFFLSFLFLFSFIYLTKNFIINGCLSYPIYFTCFELLDWGVGVEQAKLRFYHLSAQSKGYLLWLINEDYIKNIFDFFQYREGNFFISPERYIKEFNWLFFWWQYEYDIDRLLNIIYFFILSTLIIVLYNFKNLDVSKIFKQLKSNFLKIILFSVPIVSWLLLLPQSRYGGYGIIFTLSCILSLVIINSISKLKIMPIYIIVFISIFYFEYKNIDRIIRNFNSIENNTYYNFYNYPKLKYTQYRINKTFEIIINERVNNIDEVKGAPLYCNDIKGLCASSYRVNCIEDIKIRRGYIFIIPNKKNCALVIDKYLWY